MTDLNALPARCIHANPWRLTVKQAGLMDALCDAGDYKRIARDSGLAIKTIEQAFLGAARKLPGENRVQKILAWDRWRRGGVA